MPYRRSRAIRVKCFSSLRGAQHGLHRNDHRHLHKGRHSNNRAGNEIQCILIGCSKFVREYCTLLLFSADIPKPLDAVIYTQPAAQNRSKVEGANPECKTTGRDAIPDSQCKLDVCMCMYVYLFGSNTQGTMHEIIHIRI